MDNELPSQVCCACGAPFHCERDEREWVAIFGWPAVVWNSGFVFPDFAVFFAKGVHAFLRPFLPPPRGRNALSGVFRPFRVFPLSMTFVRSVHAIQSRKP